MEFSPLHLFFVGIVWLVIPIIIVKVFFDQLKNINQNFADILHELRKRGAP
jgi:hypothetical protein